jgi:hypothetical protein
MHIPPPHSNCVFRSHFGTGDAAAWDTLLVSNGNTEETQPEQHTSTGPLLTAVLLVTLVRTLCVARAMQMPRDADLVLALKLVWPTCYIMASCHTLVTSTGAVPVPVTNPGLVDAGDAIFTLKLAG